ncbi:type II secretion system F family protein [Candidatus Micrarchaeota archaeon]|nr:type II secretion system F family protein [Candidatus Micrarchaeota archaeon]
MINLENTVNKFENLPLRNIFTENSLKHLKLDIKKADLNIHARTFMVFCFYTSIATGILIFLILSLINQITNGILLGLICFGIMFFALKSIPKIKKKIRAEEFERDLPLILRSIAIQLEINMAFEKTIEYVASAGYPMSYEFDRVLKEIKAGTSVPKAFTNMAERIDSLVVKRTVNQLIITYERGGKGETLKQIANELVDIQFSKLKEFESKMSFISLIFIAVACLIPAFFEIFVIVGGMMLPVSIEPMHLWIMFLFVFPFFDILIIGIIKLKTPSATDIRKLTLKKEIYQIEKYLNEIKFQFKFKKLLIISSIMGFILGITFIFLAITFSKLLLIFALISLLLPILIFLYLSYIIEQRILKMEHALPDLLFQAASFQKGAGTEEPIKQMAKYDYGPLSNEYAIAYRQIKAGLSIETALTNMYERNSSPLIERANKMLIYGFQTGADMYQALRETAEDMFSLFSLIRERRAVLSLQKYTILIGGTMLVPLILGIVLQVMSSLDLSVIMNYLGQKIDTKSILETSSIVIPIYLVIYSFLSSYMIADQEGEPKKAVIYFIFMACLSYLIFNLAASTQLIT